ncbi:DUF5313 domain-containing protein [Pseudonocardia sp. N23]|uniref:DUF5313 domain-containing protein n=1 Tax=Pseudonocardia sp. N23 TaxID=1987376 RepID=UPI0026C7D64E|nr:DUF5313 domain-containing protein [Pseudonocardia sp. N23]
MQRPNVLRWLWYALGGGLPDKYRAWVLYDATCRTWQYRHFARAGSQLAVITIPVLLLVPGPLWVRLTAALLGWLVALQYTMSIMDESVEHRVTKAGYAPGTAASVRDEANAEQRAEATARYNARYRS